MVSSAFKISVGYCGFHLTPVCHTAVQTLLLYSLSLCAFTWLRSVNDCSDKIFTLFKKGKLSATKKQQKEKEITMTCKKTKQNKIKKQANNGPNARHRCCDMKIF